MTKWLRVLAPAVVLAITAAACSNDTSSPSGGTGGSSSAAECNADIKVGLSLDIGGLNDKSFNDAGYAGLQQAIGDGLVCEENTKFVEADSTGSNRDANVQGLAEAGYDVVIGVGFAFSPGINKLAPDYPDVNFGVIDGYATCGTACGLENDADAIPNVADLTFKEQEGSFLVGVAAALKAQELNCDTIGFLGGQTGPLIGKFEAGYRAGVKEIDPSINVLVEYIGDDTSAFVDPVKGEAISTTMFNDGACIIYHAAGQSGGGMIKAAAQLDKLAIGVDSDQYLAYANDPAQQAVIYTSMIKRVDTAVYNMIKTVGEGGTMATTVFTLADDGVGFSTSNTDLMTQDIIDQVNSYADKIISGDIVVPEDPAKV
jgi:basic membrane protein A and related proteins